MLLSFRVRNFRSIAGEVVLSLRPVDAYHELEENIITKARVKALNTVAIYGANASGKSNIVKAARFMQRTVMRSNRVNSVDSLHTDPFLLDPSMAAVPSLFEMEFVIDERVYRYGFELTDYAIQSEWLFTSLGGTRTVERPLFIREGNTLTRTNRRLMPETVKFDMSTLLPNALLLPRLDQLNGAVAKRMMRWFADLKVLSASNTSGFSEYTTHALSNQSMHDEILRFVRLADHVVDDVRSETQEMDFSTLPSVLRRAVASGEAQIATKRQIVNMMRKDVDGNSVTFDLSTQESEGTAKMYSLAGPLVDILKNGYIAFVDELEAMLHPILTRKIIRMFSNPEINGNSAQLVFVSHDALQFKMGFGRLRRDQIWLCDKDSRGRTDLYCISDMKSNARIRREEDFGRKYLEGRYGGVPVFASAEVVRHE